ncbi:MAG: hypothetical protein OEX08_02500 [Candidatus Nomurabacteria bacterium]|nr:hypothetical protein [Candidatus Nomurabacteria bacterium]
MKKLLTFSLLLAVIFATSSCSKDLVPFKTKVSGVQIPQERIVDVQVYPSTEIILKSVENTATPDESGKVAVNKNSKVKIIPAGLGGQIVDQKKTITGLTLVTVAFGDGSIKLDFLEEKSSGKFILYNKSGSAVDIGGEIYVVTHMTRPSLDC